MPSLSNSARPVWLTLGFRPFFLCAGVWAALAIALWLPYLRGTISLPTIMSPVDWHAHELLFGYVPALAAGFLLTAIPNWTGRPAIAGGALLFLVLLWLCGRAINLVSAHTGAVAALVVDAGFLAALIFFAGRELAAARNWRNMRVIAVLALMLAASVVHHLECMRGAGEYGPRIGVAAAVLLVMLIGGRIIPAFTRNWLRQRGGPAVSAEFGWFDRLAMASGALALLVWIVRPGDLATAALGLVAAICNALRLWRWSGWRTWDEPLLFVLHAAYAFVPLGFLTVAFAALAPDVYMRTAATHAWTAGVLGVMPIAVMTRVALGHTGRALTASPRISLLYVLVILAVLARVLAGFDAIRDTMLVVSTLAWVGAFAGFVLIYAPILLGPRADAKAVQG